MSSNFSDPVDRRRARHDGSPGNRMSMARTELAAGNKDADHE